MLTLSSMTGFGRAEASLGGWSWLVEARSVNGRSLELRLRAPPGFEPLERLAREAAQARFQRGQLNVTVHARRAEASSAPRVNHELLAQYAALAAELSAGGEIAPARADGLLGLRGVLDVGEAAESEEAQAALVAAAAKTVADALDSLLAARRAEGEALGAVLVGLVDAIEALTREAGAEAALQGPAVRDRFARRLAELLGEAAPGERILQEASVIALKADVREELDRLVAHVGQARALLGGDGAVGRRLDFLTQEFMREANTLCAKSATTALTSVGLALKAAIDQLREQVQNVE